MKTVSLRTFEDNRDKHAPQALAKHRLIKVTSPDGNDFVIVSATEWSQQQETLHVLQSMDLAQQIGAWFGTVQSAGEYTPTKKQVSEITGT